MARKIRDRQDALACLEAMDASDLNLTSWARSHDVDARSLHCWRMNLGWQAGGQRIVELVPEPRPASLPVARYVFRVNGVELEVDDHFREDTLARLLQVIAPC